MTATTIAGRVPAHDLDAEAAVLSACMLSATALDAALGVLAPEHFYSQANASIFEACAALAASSTPVDIMTVRNWLRDRERLDRVGGSSYIAMIADATPSITNVDAYSKQVLGKWRVRSIVEAAQRIAAEGYGDVGNVDEWAMACEASIHGVTTSAQAEHSVYIGEALVDIFKRLQAPASNADGVATGLVDLDRLMGPMRNGQLVLVAAGSGIGKSALAMNVGANVAARGLGVMFFSAEMTVDELAERALFSEARVDSSKMSRKHTITQEEWSALTGAATTLKPMRLSIDDRPNLSPLQIRAAVRKQQAEWAHDGIKPGIVIVDYIQLLNGKVGLSKNANREEEVNGLGLALKNLAKQCGIPVMALAQLNNDAAKRGDDKRPRMSDLRESKALAMHADKILLIHNPAAIARAQEDRTRSNGEALPAEEVDLILDKNRGMSTGTVKALFFPSYTTFANLGADR